MLSCQTCLSTGQHLACSSHSCHLTPLRRGAPCSPTTGTSSAGTGSTIIQRSVEALRLPGLSLTCEHCSSCMRTLVTCTVRQCQLDCRVTWWEGPHTSPPPQDSTPASTANSLLSSRRSGRTSGRPTLGTRAVLRD